MHVVTVLFTLHPAHHAEFMPEMHRNAATSLALEPGCRQFDVCEGRDHTVFLYEVYDSAADFTAHLAAPHFVQFAATTAPWVADKLVRTFTLSTTDMATPT